MAEHDDGSPEGGDPVRSEGGDPVRPEGGDPACWLSRVCPECGLLIEGALPAMCTRCGATLSDDE